MSRYLLPCSCGKTHSVSAAQAGGTIACECGQSTPIPGLRGLKLLAPDNNDEPAPTKGVPNAVNTMGLIFAISLVLLLAGGGAAGYCGWVFSQIDTKDYTEQVLKWQEGKLDEVPADKVFDIWKMAIEKPLEWEQPHHMLAREVSGKYLRYTIIAGVLAAAGLFGVIYSVLNGPRPSTAKK